MTRPLLRGFLNLSISTSPAPNLTQRTPLLPSPPPPRGASPSTPLLTGAEDSVIGERVSVPLRSFQPHPSLTAHLPTSICRTAQQGTAPWAASPRNSPAPRLLMLSLVPHRHHHLHPLLTSRRGQSLQISAPRSLLRLTAPPLRPHCPAQLLLIPVAQLHPSSSFTVELQAR